MSSKTNSACIGRVWFSLMRLTGPVASFLSILRWSCPSFLMTMTRIAKSRPSSIRPIRVRGFHVEYRCIRLDAPRPPSRSLLFVTYENPFDTTQASGGTNVQVALLFVLFQSTMPRSRKTSSSVAQILSSSSFVYPGSRQVSRFVGNYRNKNTSHLLRHITPSVASSAQQKFEHCTFTAVE
ncbi:uncharacterized protein EV420DRAFT_1568278 [Desarmillaria tabescens]|uniref:Uncharacterized protein n=1 Tax=Armillaria tabescens TaxID=1929756 RepID=A0AA39JU73_ARMTA|nr:uncharacterized protein EV420DRAFT_1568278 [Desarmillaria tabescens]KAK0447926.1 hypothetical protein EV420DRAFT_1568278 [Desarmillaria tabescens]